MELWAMWLVVVILLTVIEFATVNLVAIWFIASGVLAMITSFITKNIFIQVAVFVIFGIIFLFLTKKIVKKIKPEVENDDLKEVIGMEGIVTESIKHNKVGEVKVEGKVLDAVAEEDIPEESIVKVNNVDGAKVEVEEVKKYDIDSAESDFENDLKKSFQDLSEKE